MLLSKKEYCFLTKNKFSLIEILNNTTYYLLLKSISLSFSHKI